MHAEVQQRHDVDRRIIVEAGRVLSVASLPEFLEERRCGVVHHSLAEEGLIMQLHLHDVLCPLLVGALYVDDNVFHARDGVGVFSGKEPDFLEGSLWDQLPEEQLCQYPVLPLDEGSLE
jgi:hypothetical protein